LRFPKKGKKEDSKKQQLSTLGGLAFFSVLLLAMAEESVGFLF
jgi:hypothetical protein